MSKDDDLSRSEGPEPIGQSNQSGGVNVYGGSSTFQGDVVGHDQVKNVMQGISGEEFKQLFVPLLQSLKQAPPEKKEAAEQKVKALEEELSKGKHADDSRVADLLHGIVDLVPGAVSAVVSIFASPILAGIAGPVTKFVLGRLPGL